MGPAQPSPSSMLLFILLLFGGQPSCEAWGTLLLQPGVVTVPPAVEAGSLLTTGPPVPRIQFEHGIPGEWNWPLNYPMMSQSMFFAFRQTWFYPVSHRSVWLSLKEPIKSDKRPSKMELHRGCWQGEKHLDSMIFKWFSCLFLSNGIHYSNKMLLEIS